MTNSALLEAQKSICLEGEKTITKWGDYYKESYNNKHNIIFNSYRDKNLVFH